MKKRNYSRRRMSKLQRSQNAHRRLGEKWNKVNGKKGDVFSHYHTCILYEQRTCNRILSRKERESIFNNIKKHYN